LAAAANISILLLLLALAIITNERRDDSHAFQMSKIAATQSFFFGLFALIVLHILFPLQVDTAILALGLVLGIFALHLVGVIEVTSFGAFGTNAILSRAGEATRKAAETVEDEVQRQVREQTGTLTATGSAFIVRQPSDPRQIEVGGALETLTSIRLAIERYLRGLALCYNLSPSSPISTLIENLTGKALERHTARYLLEAVGLITESLVGRGQPSEEAVAQLTIKSNRLIRWLDRALWFHWRDVYATLLQVKLGVQIQREFMADRGIVRLVFTGAIIEFNHVGNGISVFLRDDNEFGPIPKTIWEYDMTIIGPEQAVDEVVVTLSEAGQPDS
jgi:hypothetical protein